MLVRLICGSPHTACPPAYLFLSLWLRPMLRTGGELDILGIVLRLGPAHVVAMLLSRLLQPAFMLQSVVGRLRQSQELVTVSMSCRSVGGQN